MLQTVTVSVPGKIHLMGEHAVVYGNPALLSAVNLRLQVKIEKAKTKKEEVIAGVFSQHIVRALPLIKKYISADWSKSFRLTVDSQIPFGYHLGSSAAVAVGVAGAFMQFYTGHFIKEEINMIAYEIEKLAHGNPSGGDNTAVMYGGFLWFRKELEFLKSFTPLTDMFKTSTLKNNFFLIDTGKPKESTGDMVSSVRQLFEKNPVLKKEVLGRNEEATKKVAESLYKDDEELLITSLRKGEQTLEEMEVVSDVVKPLIRDVEKSGGAAKILGGGGKTEGVGYLLCYHHGHSGNSFDIVEHIAKNYGYSIQPIQLGEEGARVE